MEMPEFSKFFAVLRGSDGRAAGEMVRALEPALRRVIHLRLIDGRLRHILDTTDILQSLLAYFLRRKAVPLRAAGKTGGLRAYLAAAVEKKIRMKLRKERRHKGGLPSGWEPACPESAGTGHADEEDLNGFVRARLSAANRVLFDLRIQGLTWPEITAKVEGNPHPNTLRMRLTRAVAEILRARGQEEVGDAG
jgi:hypothetical protein